MSATQITVSPTCKGCGAVLNLDELHYFDNGDGTATCNECERLWSDGMAEWRSGIRDDMPERP